MRPTNSGHMVNEGASKPQHQQGQYHSFYSAVPVRKSGGRVAFRVFGFEGFRVLGS